MDQTIPVITEDFCAKCGSDMEIGPCAVCFLNQTDEDDEWRFEEERRKRFEFRQLMGH